MKGNLAEFPCSRCRYWQSPNSAKSESGKIKSHGRRRNKRCQQQRQTWPGCDRRKNGSLQAKQKRTAGKMKENGLEGKEKKSWNSNSKSKKCMRRLRSLNYSS
jgi:hypothetical protein